MGSRVASSRMADGAGIVKAEAATGVAGCQSISRGSREGVTGISKGSTASRRRGAGAGVLGSVVLGVGVAGAVGAEGETETAIEAAEEAVWAGAGAERAGVGEVGALASSFVRGCLKGERRLFATVGVIGARRRRVGDGLSGHAPGMTILLLCWIPLCSSTI